MFPDITSRTHVIGLCGSPDPNPVHEDGWMYSDFFMMNHLFHGLGASQAWFVTHNPDDLFKQYGVFLHGNEYAGRRVVLNSTQEPDPASLRVHKPDQLLDAFLEYLTRTCLQASAANEPVLLCVFAHGEDLTYNIYIGESNESTSEPQLKPRDLLPILDSNRNLQLTMLMTSCFSEVWVVTPDLASSTGRRRITAMTAAGSDVESESWPGSESLGRQSGSIYISAIINTLQRTTDDINPSQGAMRWTTREFANEITHQLVDVVDARFGLIYDHQFAVQDDAWKLTYQKRTGIPLAHYPARLSNLERVSATEQNYDLNRSMTSQEAAQFEATGMLPRLAMGRFGGYMNSVKTNVRIQVMQYMRSHPGRDSLANNVMVHSRF